MHGRHRRIPTTLLQDMKDNVESVTVKYLQLSAR